MLQWLRLASYLLFLALGLRIAFTPRSRDRLQATRAFLVYVLAIHGVVAATQRDLWPFTPYKQMAVDSRQHDVWRSMIAFRTVDASEQEWRVDPAAWSPLFPPPIMEWFAQQYPLVNEAQRRDVLSFLLDKAERARQARRAGGHPGHGAWIGPLAAPDYILYWSPTASSERLVALRIYELSYNPVLRLTQPDSVRRRLIVEYRPR